MHARRDLLCSLRLEMIRERPTLGARTRTPTDHYHSFVSLLAWVASLSPAPLVLLSCSHKIFTHILRDWTSEGKSVRTAVYNPLLEALGEYVGSTTREARDDAIRSDVDGGGSDSCNGGEKDQPEPRRTDVPMASVLVPGAGLGRLAVEVAARGYASVHANELSTTS